MSDTPDPAAQALGKLRAKTLTSAHQAAAARARAAGLTADQRKAQAKAAAAARHKRPDDSAPR